MKRLDRYVKVFASVHTHPAVLTLPHPAFRLWFDLRTQWTGGNNGRLLITPAIMVRRGWTSHNTLILARDELLRRGLIKRTKYCGPNVFHKASMYALTDLDVAANEAEGISGSAASHDYRTWIPPTKQTKSRTEEATAARQRNAQERKRGVLRCPSDGQERDRATDSNGTVRRTTGGEHVTARRTTGNGAQSVDAENVRGNLPEDARVVRETVKFNYVYQGVVPNAPAVAPVLALVPEVESANAFADVKTTPPRKIGRSNLEIQAHSPNEFDRARQKYERRAAKRMASTA